MMLLPADTFYTVKGHDLFVKYGVSVGAFYKRVPFIFPNEDNSAVESKGSLSTGWFFGNFPGFPEIHHNGKYNYFYFGDAVEDRLCEVNVL